MTDLRPLSAEVYDPEATSAIRVDPREADYQRPTRLRDVAEILMLTLIGLAVMGAAAAFYTH